LGFFFHRQLAGNYFATTFRVHCVQGSQAKATCDTGIIRFWLLGATLRAVHAGGPEHRSGQYSGPIKALTNVEGSHRTPTARSLCARQSSQPAIFGAYRLSCQQGSIFETLQNNLPALEFSAIVSGRSVHRWQSWRTAEAGNRKRQTKRTVDRSIPQPVWLRHFTSRSWDGGTRPQLAKW